MASEGIVGLYVGTENYGATASFWASLGYRSTFETGHGSGQWEHPAGGPYVFVDENVDDPVVYPILGVADSNAFAPSRAPDYVQEFTPEHWGVMQALIRDPDGRVVSLQAPLPPGIEVPDAAAHHEAVYGEHSP